MTRLYLFKNDIEKFPKAPYFTLKMIPEEGADDQEWKEIAVFWKAKSGNGYSGFSNEGLVIDTSNLKEPFRKQSESKAD